MYVINRSIAIIRPKQPFVDWANRLPDGTKTSFDDFKTDNLPVLIPDNLSDEDSLIYISEIFEHISIEMFSCWCSDEFWWPQDMTSEMFWQWFNIELHSIVMDSSPELIEQVEL